MKLVYIGDHFYPESGSIMSSLYTEDGRRSDWGQVQMALKRGESVEIRQSTLNERKPYEKQLAQIKEDCSKEKYNANNYRSYFKPETIEAYAEVAYKSYCEFTDWKSLATGQDLPSWEKLPQNIKDAWCASAHAVLRRVHESRGW